MIAAIYARLSKEDSAAAEDNGIERQVQLARDLAASRGWTIAESYVLTDNGYSGANFKRPGLLRLLDGATQRPRPFDVVLTQAIDRLGREIVGVSRVMQRLTAAGVTVVCVQDGQPVAFQKPVDKLLVSVKGYGAEEFRTVIRDKTITALRDLAGRGHFVAGQTYGYARVRREDHAERVVDPTQAAVVRRVFELSAAGHGDNRICNTLAGTPAPGAKGWSKTVIRKILKNELYVGRVVYGRTTTVDDGAKGLRVRAPESEWITVERPELRIVDQALWDQVQQRKAKTRAVYLRAPDGTLLGKPESGLTSTKLLNGIGRCGTCGGALNVTGGRQSRYYCTRRYKRGPAACTNSGGVPMHAFDEAVMEQLHATLIRKPEVAAALIEDRIAQARRDQEQLVGRSDVEPTIAKLEAEITRLVSALATGKGTTDITAAIEARRAELERLRGAVPPAPPPFDRVEFFERLAKWPSSPLLHTASPVLRRQMLRKLGVDAVVVHREPDGSWSWESSLDVSRLLIDTGVPESSGRPSRPSGMRLSWSGPPGGAWRNSGYHSA